VKLVKGEGRATRARALARLASPGRAVGVAWRGVTRRDETVTVTVTSLFSLCVAALCHSQRKLRAHTVCVSSCLNRPAFGYILNSLCVILFEFHLRFNLNTCTCSVLTGSLIIVMNLLIISGIKMYRKLPSFLTASISITGFKLFNGNENKDQESISTYRGNRL
jgi:hypothetical protein